MDFDFSRREPLFEKIVFVICLDKNKMKERIIIGEVGEVYLRLDRGIGDVYFDETKPIGSMLFSFESDPDRLWNVNMMKLHESYKIINPIGNGRWKVTAQANGFLQQKYNSDTPIVKYASIRVWNEYLNGWKQDFGSQKFIDRISVLCRPFHLYGNYKPWQDESNNALEKSLHASESQIEVWYPGCMASRRGLKSANAPIADESADQPSTKRSLECVVAYSSFQPLIFYYLKRLEEWGLSFLECKICGKYFLARSRRYDMCSKKCREIQARENKRQFDERTQDILYEKIYEGAYNYWYNRLRKISKKESNDIEKVTQIKTAFAEFREEGIRQKNEVKNRTFSVSEFSIFLEKSKDTIDELMENFSVRKDE